MGEKEWIKRLKWLISHDKTPKQISEDIIMALREIDILNGELNRLKTELNFICKSLQPKQLWITRMNGDEKTLDIK